MTGAMTIPGRVPAATKRPARSSGWSKASRMSGMAGPTRVLARIPVIVTVKMRASDGDGPVPDAGPTGGGGAGSLTPSPNGCYGPGLRRPPPSP
jgi:hypothetical protein